MKELSIEEKAKAYDEALEKAKALYKTAEPMSGCNVILETLFPELKESEDEKMRKTLIAYLKKFSETDSLEPAEINLKKYIAWLEKQGEQKSVVIIPKFRVGDEIKTTNEEPLTITKIDEKGYWSNDLFICGFDEEYVWDLVEQKLADRVEPKFHEGDWAVSNLDKKIRQISEVHFDEYNSYYVVEGKSVNLEEYDRLHHLWTIQDAKDGDVLYSPCLSLLWIFKSIDTVYCGCNLNYNDGAFSGEGYIERPTDAIPATKEQRDLLFQKMHEFGYEWNAEKKELKLLITNGGDFDEKKL